MRIKAIIAAGLAIMAVGCAKQQDTPMNEAAKRYFDAWMQVHHPGLEAEENWVYIVEETEGSGEGADSSYVFVKYTSTDLEGNISATNYAEVAQQLTTYQPQNWYGPAIWYRESQQAGIYYAMQGMKIGGKRTVIIPGWLMTTSRYSTEEEYLAKESGSNAIYTIEIVEQSNNVLRWQINEMSDFLANKEAADFKNVMFETASGKLFGSIASADSTEYGFWYEGRYIDSDGNITYDTPATYVADEDDEDASPFPSDTTVYINYTGRLMNGQVFDSTIERVAKDQNVYSASRTYGPVEITWSDSYDGIKMSDNDIISGFAKLLWRMSQGRKGEGDNTVDVTNATALFWSELGYRYSGSGNVIPAYAPLIFEIEFTEEPED